MKLVVIGLGQCGCRVADEFARLNHKAQNQRGLEIVTGAFAVNTDVADLTGLSYISQHHQRRILIGDRKAGGHGVGKINERAAQIAREDGDKIVSALRTIKHPYESDAFLLIASSGGGTGSGSLPVVTKMVKDRYGDKPVYALVVLPFDHEETTEERTIYNTATCLKSVSSVADAVILVSNQRYVTKDASLSHNLHKINRQIVQPFYSLLCAGEEKKARYIGAKVLDAGDIMQTLIGWTVIGSGKTELPFFHLSLRRKDNFRDKSTETRRGTKAMDEAISELSVPCKPEDANRALYLITGPNKEMNISLIKELGDYLRDLTPNAIIRNGDYPRERGHLTVTVMLSALGDIAKVRDYYAKSTKLMPEYEKRQKAAEDKLKEIDEAGKGIPSLLG
ncbi:MAG: tubulin/FtsZ family protein [Chloroflexota bacterium]